MLLAIGEGDEEEKKGDEETRKDGDACGQQKTHQKKRANKKLNKASFCSNCYQFFVSDFNLHFGVIHTLNRHGIEHEY